jgi:type I restriction enzyme M protein
MRHKLSEAGFEVMDGLFEFLVSKSSKGAKGQYFTPRHVVELCVRMLRPGLDEVVLDPACGSGGFLVHALNYVREHHGLSSDSGLRRYSSSKLWGFDIDSKAVRVAKALMVLAGDGSANVVRLNSLLLPEMGGLFSVASSGSNEDASTLTIEDVSRSRMRRHKGFDVILTNPPFAGEVREKHVLEEYALSRGRSRIERDVLFLERCVGLLCPGGRLAIVLPHNKFATGTWAYARRWLVKKARILAVVGLGRNTFLPHTHQKASVLFVQRRSVREEPRAEQPVFFAISERDGKNSKGQPVVRSSAGESVWHRVDHDLGEIASGFDEFCRTEGVQIGA